MTSRAVYGCGWSLVKNKVGDSCPSPVRSVAARRLGSNRVGPIHRRIGPGGASPWPIPCELDCKLSILVQDLHREFDVSCYSKWQIPTFQRAYSAFTNMTSLRPLFFAVARRSEVRRRPSLRIPLLTIHCIPQKPRLLTWSRLSASLRLIGPLPSL